MRPSLADAPWPAYGGAASSAFDPVLGAAVEAARLPQGQARVTFVRTLVHNAKKQPLLQVEEAAAAEAADAASE